MESPVQSAETVGYEIPPREADCTGRRPAWHSFAHNACDEDEADPEPLTQRHLTTDPDPGA